METTKPQRPSPKWLYPRRALKVKRTAWNTKHGVKCIDTWGNGNTKVWPGEVGALVRRTITGLDWHQDTLEATFSHGRVVRVAEAETTPLDQPLLKDAWTFCTGFDPDDFVVIKRTEDVPS